METDATKIALKPGESSCYVCQVGPNGKFNCPLKGGLYERHFAKLERHDCALFVHLTPKQIERRRVKKNRKNAPQEKLF